MRFDVAERSLETRERPGAAAVADHARARAEPTVDGATIGREEQDAVGISLHEIGRDLVGFLAQRIPHISWDLTRFVGARHALETNRARRIVAVREREVVRSDRNRKTVGDRAAHAFAFVFRQDELRLERFERRRGVPCLPPPVIPIRSEIRALWRFGGHRRSHGGASLVA